MTTTKYCPVLATLGYVLSPDGKKVLLIHRNKRTDDIHYGKFNGLGGKVQENEDVVTALSREILEEAGIVTDNIVLRGTISWPGFGKNGEDWFGFLFRVDSWSGDVLAENPEGTVAWVEVAKLAEVNLWESDRAWIDMIFDNDTRTFHGIAPFSNGQMTSWSCVRI